ncbi:MAG: periplasmic L-asparaginase [Saprospiraceae bacterium]|nr:MAG: periplasmic L-asparaginase [Saprospiraceae bacterium]
MCVFSLIANAQQDKDIATVESILLRQANAWNRGDIDAFMQDYWKSDDLQFIGGNGVTYGWQNTLEGYKKRYPTPEAMGHLTFDIIKVEKLNKKVIALTGKFTLLRKNDTPTGHFLLLWRKIKGSWVIIADCTSPAS